MNHMIHHRGQLTVYLRLTGAKVPALYGPARGRRQYVGRFGGTRGRPGDGRRFHARRAPSIAPRSR